MPYGHEHDGDVGGRTRAPRCLRRLSPAGEAAGVNRGLWHTRGVSSRHGTVGLGQGVARAPGAGEQSGDSRGGVSLVSKAMPQRDFFRRPEKSVVLENSNVAQLASALYLLVHSLPQEDRYDTDDASAREIDPFLVPAATLRTVQSLRQRQYRASLLDRQGQTPRTLALPPVPPGVLRAGGPLDGAEQAVSSDRGPVAAMSAVGCL